MANRLTLFALASPTCVPNCLSCSSDGGGKCEQCNDGYDLNSEKTCDKKAVGKQSFL